MALPTTLIGGLTARFDADLSLTALVPAGLYVGQYPEDVALPFVVLVHLGEVPEWTTERSYTEAGQVQFHCFAEGAAAAEALATLVKATFDWCALTVSGAHSVSVQRMNYLVSAEELRAGGGQLVYLARVDYATELARSY